MNLIHVSLYRDLMNLVEESDGTFYFVEHQCEGITFRVFTYRLASYTDFTKPSALESRGIMFQMESGEPVRLAALPPAKFFNYKENPMVMDLDFRKSDLIMDKMDGSIMTTYTVNDNLYLKSKTSLSSEQANAAMEFLFSGKVEPLVEFLTDAEKMGFSVSLEWTSPIHRIVLPYQEDRLTVLHVRGRDSLTVMSYDALKPLMTLYGAEEYLVPSHPIDDVVKFVENIPSMVDVEGYIIQTDGVLTKHKTDWYCALHHLKDDMDSPRKRFIAVVNEAGDDARAQFAHDQAMIDLIDETERKVKDIYKLIDINVTGFYNANRELERKDYAIKGTKELDRLYFSLAMNLYVGKENDYKGWMIKHFKEFGISDIEPETE